MRQIYPVMKHFEKIGSPQKIEERDYRLSHHVMTLSVTEGVLLYHKMTGEMLLLTSGEWETAHADGALKSELIKRWFLVPEDFDEYELSMKIREIAAILTPKKPGINSFTVFPTTDCNARCFYCYEKGRRRQSMDEKTALDVAAYIRRVSAGQDVQLNWFGGEPLYNSKAIDIICDELTHAGVPFTSRMISNGYLFDEETVKKAVGQWKLHKVQIPLDGTEETYNRAKAFIYKEGSAFKKVLGSIDLLLDAGVDVVIRMNVSRENAWDLERLAGELHERYRGEKRPGIYCVLLKEFGNKEVGCYEDAAKGVRAFERLGSRIVELGLGHIDRIRRDIPMNRCMADSDRSVTVLPDGRLGKCEHESEEKLIGSIYDDEVDAGAVSAWKERIFVPECRICLFAPTCIKLKACAWNKDGCSEADRELMRVVLRQSILSEYKKQVKKQFSDDEI
ncbi:MAG: radical SAM protein [Lachnospiraceae bacterium]|nr:radical SAM protein [Lachnospiraceae bacterium]